MTSHYSKDYKTLEIDELAEWNRELSDKEIKTICSYDSEWTNVNIGVKSAEGFWNRLFFRKRITIHINGENNISYIIKNNRTFNWWVKTQ